MEKHTGWIAIVCLVLGLAAGFGVGASVQDNVEYPSASEIAELVKVPSAGEFDSSALEERLDSKLAHLYGVTKNVDYLMDEAYAEEKSTLESEGLAAYDEEYNEDDLEDFLKDTIEGFDRLRDVDVDEDFGDEGVKLTILDLGLEDDEDKRVLVVKQYDVRYELDDNDDVLKAKVLVTAEVTYDDEFEADLEYILV